MIAYVHHELRASVDTRGSVAILIMTAFLAASCVGITAAAQGDAPALAVKACVDALLLVMPLGIALVVILSTTGEWAHKTGRVALPLVRSRRSFYAAKCVAMFLLSMALYVTGCLVVCVFALFWAFCVDKSSQFDGVLQQVAMGAFAVLLAAVFGFGLASLFRSLGIAITAAFLVTLVWNVASGVYLGEVAPYVSSLTPLAVFDDKAGGTPATAILSSIIVWYVLPVAGGLYRYLRSDV